MMSLEICILVGFHILNLVWSQTSSVQYIFAGENVGCTDYTGFQSITTLAECSAAGAILNFEDPTASTRSSSIYPRGCYAQESGTNLYFNTASNAPLIGSSTRWPVCKSSSKIIPESICFSQGNGFDSTGGSTTPNINEAGLLTCSSSFSFTPYDRQGYMYFAYNPYVQGDTDWGLQKWKLNNNTAYFEYGVLYQKIIDNAPYDQGEFDSFQGIAVDNTNDCLYSIFSHRYDPGFYERYLTKIDLSTGTGTTILHDYYPYNCHPMNDPTFRAIMDIDEVNQILYWMDNDGRLFSLDLTASPLQIKYEVTATASQWSQLRVDCNGNVWYTDIGNGLWLYKPGWNAPYNVINEAGLNGIEFIRTPGSTEMTFIVGNKFVLRSYTASGLLTNTYSIYPSPPEQNDVGSAGDIYHNIIYDVQNNKMCGWVRKNLGDYLYLCYDPFGDTNLVWNFIYGPLPREYLGIRFGDYYVETPSPTTGICMKYKGFVSSVSGDCGYWDQYTTAEGWDSSSANGEASCAQACKDTAECDYGIFMDYSGCNTPSRCFLMGSCVNPSQSTWSSCSDDTIYDYQCVQDFTTTPEPTPRPTPQPSQPTSDPVTPSPVDKDTSEPTPRPTPKPVTPTPVEDTKTTPGTTAITCSKYKSFVSSVSGDCTLWQQYSSSDGWDQFGDAEISCAQACKANSDCDYGFFLDYSGCNPSRCFLMGGCVDAYQGEWSSCSDDTIYDYGCVIEYTQTSYPTISNVVTSEPTKPETTTTTAPVSESCTPYKSYVSSVSDDCTFWEQYTTEDGWDQTGDAEFSCAKACQANSDCDYGIFVDYSRCNTASRCFLMGGCVNPSQLEWSSCSDDTIYDLACVESFTQTTTTTTAEPTKEQAQDGNGCSLYNLFATALVILFCVVSSN